jgi:hypothetical protein
MFAKTTTFNLIKAKRGKDIKSPNIVVYEIKILILKIVILAFLVYEKKYNLQVLEKQKILFFWIRILKNKKLKTPHIK